MLNSDGHPAHVVVLAASLMIVAAALLPVELEAAEKDTTTQQGVTSPPPSLENVTEVPYNHYQIMVPVAVHAALADSITVVCILKKDGSSSDSIQKFANAAIQNGEFTGDVKVDFDLTPAQVAAGGYNSVSCGLLLVKGVMTTPSLGNLNNWAKAKPGAPLKVSVSQSW